MDSGRRNEIFNTECAPHAEALYNYGLYLSGDREAASDLLQETFLKAFRFIDKFQAGSNARAWLHRIMHNTYINEYRRKKRLPDLIEFDERQTEARKSLGEGDALHGRIEGEIFGDEVATAMAHLPEKLKSVIILRDIEDLPYEEIAQVLDIPIGTVRSRLHRARALLFERLKDYARARGLVGESDLLAEGCAFAS
jgi:RNA polymerase sigma factor (sigma-70 family)